MILRAPFPYFGAKRRVAHIVWERFGDVPNYVEPFAGSLAVLLGRPHEPRCETVNDLDCFLSNFWRAMQSAPDEVERYCDWPVNETDLHARHRWLVDRLEFRERMKVDPDYFDAKIAGWWVWGISQWIGSGWCSRPEYNRGLPNTPKGIHAKRPRLAAGERGVNRKMPRIDRGGSGVDNRNPSRQMPCLSGDSGAYNRGVNASGVEDKGGILPWFHALSDRLRRVRVCCGDWSRILGPSPTTCIGMTAVFLDPPYSERAGRDSRLYSEDSLSVAHRVREWAIEHGPDPLLRIALCGYEGEHQMPDDWLCVAWKASGGYGAGKGNQAEANAERERIWFSPNCLVPDSSPKGEQLEIEMT